MTRAALALLALLMLAGAAEGALPSPPFALDVAPARVKPGQSVQLTITPRQAPGVFDLYVMWAHSPEAAFLRPDGVWSPARVALRAGVPAAGAPITMRWVPTPSGEIPLALVVIPAGGDPLARFAWTFRPLVTWVSAPALSAAPPLNPGMLAPLVLGTLAACVVVVLAGKPFFG